ncbi:3-isopropylmalate dehydratase [Paenibacillus sp. FSL H3-0286]|uniref:3-isopropylmalate dehydratase n=1 Tax=Paenibacillus sp. FSL H3-0286 TaxID=2921427 RepID=UPI003243A6C9
MTTLTLSTELRSPETILINSKLQIIKLSNQKFRLTKNSYIMPSGYALYHPTFGFFGFKSDKKPYSPVGGKKALQSILNDGGLLDFDNSVWWLPMEV